MRSCELFAQAGLELNCNPDLSLPSIWVWATGTWHAEQVFKTLVWQVFPDLLLQ
jgi:hypothetical protein